VAVRPAAERAAATLEHATAWLEGREQGTMVATMLADGSTATAEERRAYRAELLRRTAAGLLSPDEAQERLEAMREIDRVLYHAWRAVHHLTAPPDEAPFQPSTEEMEVL
jgi:hypothetical protein